MDAGAKVFWILKGRGWVAAKPPRGGKVLPIEVPRSDANNKVLTSWMGSFMGLENIFLLFLHTIHGALIGIVSVSASAF